MVSATPKIRIATHLDIGILLCVSTFAAENGADRYANSSITRPPGNTGCGRPELCAET
jgi:hypothetical protein